MTGVSGSQHQRILNEANGEHICQNDNTVPACMAAATTNPNDIRGSVGALGLRLAPPPEHPSLAATAC